MNKLIVFFLITGICFSKQKIDAYTLDECFELSLKNNEVIKIQNERIMQAGERIEQVSDAVFPNLDIKLQSFLRDNPDRSITANGTDSRLYLTQPLFYGFRKQKNKVLSKTEKYLEELLLQDIKRKLYTDVAQAFYTLAMVDSDLKNIDEILNLMKNRQNELNERVRLGKSRESEIYTLESQIAVLLSNKQKILGDYIKASKNLSFLTGEKIDDFKISENYPEPEAVESVDKIFSKIISRSDIQIAKEELNAQDIRVSIVKGELLPTFDLNSSWYLTRSGSLSDSKWDIYFLLGIPLFQQGIVRSKIREEFLKSRELKENFSLISRKFDTEIRQLHSSLESSILQVAILKDGYKKALKSYELLLKDYRLGMVNNLDVIQATLTLLDVKSNLDRTILQAKLNKILLEIAVK